MSFENGGSMDLDPLKSGVLDPLEESDDIVPLIHPRLFFLPFVPLFEEPPPRIPLQRLLLFPTLIPLPFGIGTIFPPVDRGRHLLLEFQPDVVHVQIHLGGIFVSMSKWTTKDEIPTGLHEPLIDE
jgi:hypothetical protein